MELHVLPSFVEERTQQAPGYVDYMQAIHKAVLTSK